MGLATSGPEYKVVQYIGSREDETSDIQIAGFNSDQGDSSRYGLTSVAGDPQIWLEQAE
ncbi:unnamed protein product [Caretta caretta]